VAAEAPCYVLDSFALLAYLADEPGAAQVTNILKRGGQNRIRILVPMINLGEVLYITERESGLPDAHKALAAFEQLPITLVEVTKARVLAAAHIKATHAVSYADAFVVAIAQEFDAVVVTGDREFKAVESLIAIE
jgi:ribonuclease VapC